MVISKKDKQKFKKAMSAKSSTEETTKRGRGRPSKAEKLDKKVDYSLPKEKRVVWDGIIDTQEEITKEIVIPDLKETLVEEKVQEEIKQDEGTEISEQVPNFLDEEEVKEAISERKDELSAQREELEEVKEDFSDIELDGIDELDLSDLEDETVEEKADEIVVEEVKEPSDEIEDLDLSDLEDEIIEEKTSVEITPEHIETQETKEEQEEVIAKEEVEEVKVEEKEKTKSGFMDMWNKNKNYVIIGAVALAIAWAGIFAFKDKIFWNEQPVKPVVQEQTPVEQNTKEEEKQPEIKETQTVDLFTKAELTEENKLILNKLVPMSLSLEKGLQEIYDAKKTNETNHWTIKNYDKKYKKTSIVDIQTQINQNLQDIKWVDDAEDDLVKGKSDTDSEGNELSPEEKMKRENNPALSVKKYNWDEGDIKGEIKTSLTIKQGKEKKYGFKINADVEGKKDTTYMFFKNFGINTKDQDLIDKSELDKFSLQNKMLTVSDEKENKEMLGLLGEYRTQLLGFNFLANILNNSEVEGSDEPVKFVDTKEVEEVKEDEEEATPVVEKKTKKKELVTTSTNGVKEEKPEVEEKEVKEEAKETSEEKEKGATTIENKKETETKEATNTKETDETKEVKDEEKDSLKASYKIKVSGNTIKEELQNILRVKESLTKVFLENGTSSPLKEFVEAIKEEDTLNIHYDTKENKALVSWELAGYSVKGIIGDKEEIILTKDGKETKIALTLTDIIVKAKITSEKEETLFESGLLAKDGIYKTHFLLSKNLIKKNGKKANVYKLSNRGVLAKDNEQLPVYAKEHTKENLKGKYEVNFNFITTEYNKLIEKAFGVKEDNKDNKEKETVVEEKEKENKEVAKNEEKTEEDKKETEKKEVKVEDKNSKEEKVKNPVKEVFKEVEKEDAKVWAGVVAEQPK